MAVFSSKMQSDNCSFKFLPATSYISSGVVPVLQLLTEYDFMFCLFIFILCFQSSRGVAECT